MNGQFPTIDPGQLISNIVRDNYRTAEVFRRYEISYCCGGRQPLETVCSTRGIDINQLTNELAASGRVMWISPTIDFASWDIIFMTEYILNVHHAYLQKNLEPTQVLLHEFANAHAKQFPYLRQLETKFAALIENLNAAMSLEEQEVFPYTRQLYHAYKHQEPYAGLFIRTLRKPVQEEWEKGHAITAEIIGAIRELCNQYNPPENACVSHQVVLSKLKEVDNDLAQHSWFEQHFLLPAIGRIEKELLMQPNLPPQLETQTSNNLSQIGSDSV